MLETDAGITWRDRLEAARACPVCRRYRRLALLFGLLLGATYLIGA